MTQIEPSQIQYGVLGTNLLIIVMLIDIRVKVALLWKDYASRKKLNGG